MESFLRTSSSSFNAPRQPGTNVPMTELNPFEHQIVPERDSPSRLLQNKQSFGGGFQFPKKNKQVQWQMESNRKGAKSLTPQEDLENKLANRGIQHGDDLIGVLESELQRLKQEQNKFTNISTPGRKTQKTKSPLKESTIHMRTWQPGQVPEEKDWNALSEEAEFMTLPELEALREAHEAKLCKAEAFYYREKTRIPEKHVPGSSFGTQAANVKFEKGAKASSGRTKASPGRTKASPGRSKASPGRSKASLGRSKASPGGSDLEVTGQKTGEVNWHAMISGEQPFERPKQSTPQTAGTNAGFSWSGGLGNSTTPSQAHAPAQPSSGFSWSSAVENNASPPKEMTPSKSGNFSWGANFADIDAKPVTAPYVKKPVTEREKYENAYERYREKHKKPAKIQGHVGSKYNAPEAYKPKQFDSPEEITLLKWLFEKLDKDRGGTIDKFELLTEIHQSEHLAKLFGFNEDILAEDYMSKFDKAFDTITKREYISKDEFMDYFCVSDADQSKSKKAAHKSPKKSLSPRRKSPRRSIKTDTHAAKPPKPAERVCLLSAKQIGVLGSVFDVLDSHNDLVVKRGAIIHAMREDSKISKMLLIDALKLNPGQILNLEEVLDYIASDGKTDSLLTWKQFLDYFYKKPEYAEIAGRTGAVLFDDDPRLDEILLSQEYIDKIKALFDQLPKMTPNEISTHKFVSSFQDDPSVKILLDFTAREPRDIGKRPAETMANLLRRMNEEGNSLIVWEDVLGYLSVRGDPKPREDLDESHEMPVTLIPVKEPRKNIKDTFMQTDAIPDPVPMRTTQSAASFTRAKKPQTVKARTQSIEQLRQTYDDLDFYGASNIKGKDYRAKSASPKRFAITVPQPFAFDIRDKYKKKGIRERWLEQDTMEREMALKKEIAKKPKPNKIPEEVKIPLFDAINKEQEAKREEVKRKSLEITKANERPFSFYERDLEAKKAKDNIKHEKVKAKSFVNPIPWKVTVPLYEKMVTEDIAAREERVSRAAQESLTKSSLPPRMQQYEETRKQRENQPVQYSVSESFKAKDVPNFSKQQKAFKKALESKKAAKRPVETQPFEFASDKRMQAKSIKNATMYECAVDDAYDAAQQWKTSPGKIKALEEVKIQPSKTAKYEAQVRLMQATTASKIRQEQTVADEEQKRHERYLKLKPRVQNSSALVDIAAETKIKNAETAQQRRELMQENERNYKRNLKKINEKVADRPLLFEQDWTANKQAELAKIKQLMRTRDVLVEQKLNPKHYFNEEELNLIEEGDYYKKKGRLH